MDIQTRIAKLHEGLENSETYAIEMAKAVLSDDIYDAMVARGITRAQLAERLGVSRSDVSKLLRGDVNYTIETLVKVARALGCDLDVSNVFTFKQPGV